MQAGKGVGDAYKLKLFSQLKADAVANQMSQISIATDQQVRQISAQGKKVVSAQEQAFLKGGVELEGSAMDVIAETVADVAEASYIRQMESGFQLENLAMEKSRLDSEGSDINFLLNSAASVTNAYASYQGDLNNYNRATTRGARGIS